MYRKLNLDRDKVDQCRNLAQSIMAPVLRYVSHHSSTSIEAACLSLIGISGEKKKRSFAFSFVEILGRDRLRSGACLWLGRVMVHANLSPQSACEQVVAKKIKFDAVAGISVEQARSVLREHVLQALRSLDDLKRQRDERGNTFPLGQPLTQLIIPVERIEKVHSAVNDAFKLRIPLVTLIAQGKKKPFEEPTEKLAQELTRLGTKKEKGKLGVESSHLFSPEFAVMAVKSGVDMVVADPLTDILMFEINMKRALIDHHFQRRLLARAGVLLMTLDDRFLSAVDIARSGYQQIVLSFLHEAFNEEAQISPELFSLTHAFSLNPSVKEGMLHEFAHAQVMRELYLRHPLHYLSLSSYTSLSPSLRASTLAVYHLIALLTEQNIVTLPTNGDHPRDRSEMLSCAGSLLEGMSGGGDEITMSPNGKIARRAHTLLENSWKLLRKIQQVGLMKSFSEGIFGGMICNEEKGEGLEGVFQKERGYFNPLFEEFQLTTKKEEKEGEKHGRHRRHSQPALTQ